MSTHYFSFLCTRLNSGAGESSLRGVGDDWSSVHLKFFVDVIWRQQHLQLRFQVTSLASWSCRRTTHQHQSTWLYCRVHVGGGQSTWPCHVSTIWLRVGEVEQEERVSVCWRWSWVTSKSRPHLTLKQCPHCTVPCCVKLSESWTKLSFPSWRYERRLYVKYAFRSLLILMVAFAVTTFVVPVALIRCCPRALTLSWQDHYVTKMTYKPSKLGQTDLIFGLWSEFISRYVQAWLQVYACSMICATLLHTHKRTSLAQPDELTLFMELNI